MDRYVIKGRGENRGKYLCYARMAGLPPDAGYVWLPEQRKAARWEDPIGSQRNSAHRAAQEHDGYFVKLIAPKDITSRVDDMEGYIARRASASEEATPCHWFDGDLCDAGDNYCLNCAQKIVDEKWVEDQAKFESLYGECHDAKDRYSVAIDGGFDGSHDSLPYCEKCGAKLSGNLTDYGADQELDALTTYAAPGPKDVEEWDALNRAIVNLEKDDPWWRKIAQVVDASMAAEEAEARAHRDRVS